MKDPARLIDGAGLPPELALALRSAPGAPSAAELQALGQELGARIGIGLTVPRALPSSAGKAAAGAAKSAATAKATGVSTLTGVGAWVAGGLALGVGLSSVTAYVLERFESSTPHAVVATGPTPAASVSTRPLTLEPLVPAAAGSVGSEPRLAAPARAAVKSLAPADDEPELSVLQRARAALGRDPERALELCADHAARFGTAALAQEREVIAIEALLQLGRRAAAKTRAERFRIAFPGSAHLRRIDSLLEQPAARDE